MHHVWSSVGLRLFFFPSTVSLSFYLGHGDDLPLFLIRARLLRCCFCSVEQSQHPSHLDSNDSLFLLSQGRGSHRPMHLTLILHKNEMKDDFLISARLASVIRLRFFSSLSCTKMASPACGRCFSHLEIKQQLVWNSDLGLGGDERYSRRDFSLGGSWSQRCLRANVPPERVKNGRLQSTSKELLPTLALWNWY